MSHLTQEGAAEVIAYNQQILYRLPSRYENLNALLSENLRKTLLGLYRFIKRRTVIIEEHKYLFFIHTEEVNRIRKYRSRAESNHHLSFLAALGLINRQTVELEVNRNFLQQSNRKREMNVFSFRKYTKQELDRIEQRAAELRAAKITVSGISYNKLMARELQELAEEVYPFNSKTAPERKEIEFEEVLQFIDMAIEQQGYTTKQQIKDNLLLDDRELDKIFNIYGMHLREFYNYRRPTKKQMEEWNLPDMKYIYTKKETE